MCIFKYVHSSHVCVSLCDMLLPDVDSLHLQDQLCKYVKANSVNPFIYCVFQLVWYASAGGWLAEPGSRACSKASSPGRDTCYYPSQVRNINTKISLDAESYPKLLSQHVGPQNRCRAQCSCLCRPGNLWWGAATPDAITAPQATPSAVAKAKPKAKANSAPQNALVSSVFGRLYITRGTCKSYIQYDGKFKLLTGLNGASCPNHQTAVEDLAAWVAKNPKAPLAQVSRSTEQVRPYVSVYCWIT